MKKICLTLLCLVSALLTFSQADKNNPDFSELAKRVDMALSTQGVFSGTILLMSADEVLLDKGYGFSDCEMKIKTKPGSTYDMGSITKAFTATLALRLVQNQKLALDARVSSILPQWPKDKDDITIENLIWHTSGIKDSFGDDEVYISKDSLIDKIIKSNLLFAPGEGQQYSNAGYSLLGHIIEVVSKMSYDAYLEREILKPLRLKNTGYHIESNLACGILNGKKWGTVPDYYYKGEPSWYLKCNGGMLTTSRDLNRFFDAFLKGEVLPSKLKDYVLENVRGKSPSGAEIFRLSGANNIFSSVYYTWLSRNVSFVLFTNDSRYPKEKIEPLIVQEIEKFLAGH